MNFIINTILIVDDQPLVRLIMTRSLEEVGDYAVLHAGNGQEALENVMRQRIDMVMCDLNMPESDGLYLLKHLSKLRYSGSVLLISGEDDSLLKSARVLAGYYRLNILGIAAKPLKSEQLREYVKQANELTNLVSRRKTDEISYERLSELIRQKCVCSYFQPQYSLNNLRISGFEALARIKDGDQTLSPVQFIPTAEKSDLIDSLTKEMITASVRSFSRVSEEHRNLSLSLNISSRVLEDEAFPGWLDKLTDQYRISNHSVICELTETMLSDDPAAVHVGLLRLRLLKFRLSIDDFGTGYASLSQLHALPFNELKIDRRFITDLLTNETSLAVCTRSLALAGDLGLSSVAEGIEDAETCERLRTLGCDYAQGFCLARPVEADLAVSRVNQDHTGVWGPN